MRYIFLALAGMLLLSSCTPGASDSTTTPEPAPAPQAEKPRSKAEELAAYDKEWFGVISGNYPGYPLIVSVDSLDPRLADRYRAVGATQAVALMPAVYTPYIFEADLVEYLSSASDVEGSCMMIRRYIDGKEVMYEQIDPYRTVVNYACWDDVAPGSEEPTY